MEVALLAFRVIVGLLFAGHGAQKLFGWFGGHGVEGTGGFFESIGLRPGKFHARAAGFNESAGGLLLAAGLFTPLAALLVVATMTAAVMTVHAKNGPWNTDNGWELNVLYAAAALVAAAIGAGELSLDHALSLDVAGLEWAAGALVLGVAGGVGAVLSGRAVTERENRAGRDSSVTA